MNSEVGRGEVNDTDGRYRSVSDSSERRDERSFDETVARSKGARDEENGDGKWPNGDRFGTAAIESKRWKKVVDKRVTEQQGEALRGLKLAIRSRSNEEVVKSRDGRSGDRLDVEEKKN